MKKTANKTVKTETDEYNSGNDKARNDYRSSQHNTDSGKITKEGNTHRSGQATANDNDNEDDKDSMHEK